jgi:hypothetical protein
MNQRALAPVRHVYLNQASTGSSRLLLSLIVITCLQQLNRRITLMICNQRNNQDLYLGWFLPIFIVLIAGCSSAPKMAPTSTFPSGLAPVTRYALSLVGAPYRYGKASPAEGFDCSGFVQHVYGRYGVGLPRTAREMAMMLPPAEPYRLRSGDLVFFDTEGNGYSHVGLFVQGDEFVHASSNRSGKVMVSSLNNPYWRRHYSGARRVR